ncbi:hypothetical protein CBG04_08420 [Limosilactobacillus reuteri]|uniref:hypothetical protein n=1 Tax=Limosilactobacillus reuteri TaxID=1598 RepID=UPI000B9972F3|nr:hypothetical protein [Limosilactobacillus reuteri]OYS80572.1 hypothetical protein CBG11_06995 [Limosilactobacillus reuteri]OYS82441.1 hypothetical protein CBG04_08420 [Limosilactobacillus reuteri]OYS83012.1 hypothetical protein CBG14_09000 [Limosilactobacillus reuteri]
MEILTANDALKRLDELNVTYLTVGRYSIGDSSELLISSEDLNEIFRILETKYANGEALDKLSGGRGSTVWLVAFEKDSTGKWKALFYSEELNEIWIDL